MREAESLQASDEEIAKLLRNSDETLKRWFESFLSAEESDLILAGGEPPPTNRIGGIFDRWFERRRDQLRELLCGRLGYGTLSHGQRNTGEVVVVAIIAAAITTTPLPDAIDPLLTASLLVARNKLDGLCGNFEPPQANPDD